MKLISLAYLDTSPIRTPHLSDLPQGTHQEYAPKAGLSEDQIKSKPWNY